MTAGEEPIRFVEELEMEEEVVHWSFDENGYHAFTATGKPLNIVRSLSLQPPIASEDDYYTWLWLETLQGFYVARQRIVEAMPQGWWLVRQVVPASPHLFFQHFSDELEAYVMRLPLP